MNHISTTIIFLLLGTDKPHLNHNNIPLLGTDEPHLNHNNIHILGTDEPHLNHNNIPSPGN